VAPAFAEAARRQQRPSLGERLYRADRPPPDLRGRTLADFINKTKTEKWKALVEILGVGEGRALLEPLGGQCFRRNAMARPAVGQRDATPDHGLRGVGDSDHSEAEGEPHLHVPLEALDVLQLHLHALDSSRPAT